MDFFEQKVIEFSFNRNLKPRVKIIEAQSKNRYLNNNALCFEAELGSQQSERKKKQNETRANGQKEL